MASSKSSKKKSSGSPRSYSEVYKSSATTGAPVAPQSVSAGATKSVATRSSAPALASGETVDWWGEYGYVLNDLKYLGLVTLGLLIAIIVVGFFFT